MYLLGQKLYSIILKNFKLTGSISNKLSGYSGAIPFNNLIRTKYLWSVLSEWDFLPLGDNSLRTMRIADAIFAGRFPSLIRRHLDLRSCRTFRY